MGEEFKLSDDMELKLLGAQTDWLSTESRNLKIYIDSHERELLLHNFLLCGILTLLIVQQVQIMKLRQHESER